MRRQNSRTAAGRDADAPSAAPSASADSLATNAWALTQSAARLRLEWKGVAPTRPEGECQRDGDGKGDEARVKTSKQTNKQTNKQTSKQTSKQSNKHV